MLPERRRKRFSGLAIMRKNLLILVLCGPLFWLTWEEAKRLYVVSTWAPPKASEDDGTDRPSKAELAKAKTAAEALVAPADGVTASVFRLDSQTLVPATGDPLTTTLVNHAAKRAERKKKLVGHKLDSSDIEKKINDARNQMLGGDGWPKRLDAALERSLATLRQELDRYEKNVHDPELLASARAEVAWPELNDKLPRAALLEAYDLIDGWSPKKPETSPIERQNFGDYVEHYGAYVKEHGLAKGPVAVKLVREATERLALAERGGKLVQILKSGAKGRLEQISAVVNLDDDSATDRIRSTLRHLARELCDDLLKRELYDEKVKLITGNSNETVKRKDVFIKLRDEEEAKPLEPQGGLDEYTLKPEQVENVVLAGEVREPPAGGVSPLQGTPYSDAIKDFNTQRDQIKQWSEAELTTLRDSCLLKKPVLDGGGGTGSGGPTLIPRIEGLIKIVRQDPRLFAESSQ